MAYNLRCVDRDQQYLMPPSLREWLPAGHLSWFVLDVMEELDLSSFYLRLRPDGRGGSAYDPALLVAVLVYAYCVGDRSSRVIERRLVEDVAYRVVAANATPDHATIARFRADHEAALEGLFAQALALCASAGLVKLGVVALDGTKIEANASKAANMDHERLRKALEAEARRILAEAAAVDAAEDELYGDARGDELPAELAERSRRLRRLREAKERLAAAEAEREAAQAAADGRRQADTAAGRKKRGRKPTKPAPPPEPLRINATDPQSRLMKTPGGFCQGYNAQALVSAGQIVLAARLTDCANDVACFVPVLAEAHANLEAAGVEGGLGTVLADAGYYSTANATHEAGCEPLIATTKAHKLPTEAPNAVAPPDDEIERAAHRAGVLERMVAEELTLEEAAALMGLSIRRTSDLRRIYRSQGVQGLVRKRRGNGEGNRAAQRRAAVRARMEARLASEEGRALYRLRSQLVEPVFGQIKDPRGFRRFSRRGLAACGSEWSLMVTTHNLLKLWRSGRRPVLAGI